MAYKIYHTVSNLLFMILTVVSYYFIREVSWSLFDFADAPGIPIPSEASLGWFGEIIPFFLFLLLIFILFLNIFYQSGYLHLTVAILDGVAAIMILVSFINSFRFFQIYDYYNVYRALGQFGFWSYILPFLCALFVIAGSLFMFFFRKKYALEDSCDVS